MGKGTPTQVYQVARGNYADITRRLLKELRSRYMKCIIHLTGTVTDILYALLFLYALDELNNEQTGMLFKAIYHYQSPGFYPPDLDFVMRIAISPL
jgi:hypothetical protein